ncbi:MAG: ferritin-like domain-containing protein [Bdellovibrionales bacterium]|nr:ferritin-like domain-containing protein [Bdellovibrionales bacterium]
MTTASSTAITGGDLTLGSGLLAVLRPALLLTEEGGVVSLASTNSSNRFDLPRWCQVEHHHYLRCESQNEVDTHFIQRGPFPRLRHYEVPSFELTEFSLEELTARTPFPKTAQTTSAFAPRGADLEEGRPNFPFSIHDHRFAGPPEVARLYDQATKNQWSSLHDIPWRKLKPLPRPLNLAVSQVMTFLAENEFSALYLPSRFVSTVHPYFMETSLFLATQLADEARHIDAFMKRAWACGEKPGVSAVSTADSLLSLLKSRDFLEATFLLSVLGEGTFLDLLAFIENHAPDDVTAEIVRRARQDESRHVHFGIAHVQHSLSTSPSVRTHLKASVERRASDLANMSGAPTMLQDALVVLAAGDTSPKNLRRGHDKYRELLDTMSTNRIKRLKSSGFSEEEADYLSELHTPNFM